MRFQNGAKKTHAVKFENGANLELTSASARFESVIVGET